MTMTEKPVSEREKLILELRAMSFSVCQRAAAALSEQPDVSDDPARCRTCGRSFYEDNPPDVGAVRKNLYELLNMAIRFQTVGRAHAPKTRMSLLERIIRETISSLDRTQFNASSSNETGSSPRTPGGSVMAPATEGAAPEYEPYIVGGRIKGWSLKNCPPAAAAPDDDLDLPEEPAEWIKPAVRDYINALLSIARRLKERVGELRQQLNVEQIIRVGAEERAESAERRLREIEEAGKRALPEEPITFSHHFPGGKGCEAVTFQEYHTLRAVALGLVWDSQAMALVKKFGLNITHFYWDDPTVEKWDAHHNLIAEARNADLNRAICECVAKMQKAKVTA